ncbi:MAG: hypothetical protein WDO73_25205 [Ignavibacteriota bacterium]
MSVPKFRLAIVAIVYCAAQGLAQPPSTQLNPTVKKIVEEVSEERIGATMKRLGDFGTRYVGSETDNPTHGIGAATKWIESEFKSYSPRLQVSLQPRPGAHRQGKWRSGRRDRAPRRGIARIARLSECGLAQHWPASYDCCGRRGVARA